MQGSTVVITVSITIDEADLVERLRSGDESAFAALVDEYYQSLLHVARGYVASKEAAEDVVQETFLGIITGISRFEGRSSLKTWMFRILVNRARTRGEREGRTRPFSSLADGADEPAVDPDRFAKDGRWAGHWTSPPSADPMPEAHVLADEFGDRLLAAMATLPEAQRAVLELRDVRGFGSQEVCELLEISEANQRVLLHRARSKTRALLEQYVAGAGGVA
jgi:RNA polymerase sigma-70 factor (ECF subfamily)